MHQTEFASHYSVHTASCPHPIPILISLPRAPLSSHLLRWLSCAAMTPCVRPVSPCGKISRSPARVVETRENRRRCACPEMLGRNREPPVALFQTLSSLAFPLVCARVRVFRFEVCRSSTRSRCARAPEKKRLQKATLWGWGKPSSVGSDSRKVACLSARLFFWPRCCTTEPLLRIITDSWRITPRRAETEVVACFHISRRSMNRDSRTRTRTPGRTLSSYFCDFFLLSCHWKRSLEVRRELCV